MTELCLRYEEQKKNICLLGCLSLRLQAPVVEEAEAGRGRNGIGSKSMRWYESGGRLRSWEEVL